LLNVILEDRLSTIFACGKTGQSGSKTVKSVVISEVTKDMMITMTIMMIILK